MTGRRADRDELLDIAVTTARRAGDLLLDYAARRGEGDDLQIGAKTSLTDLVSAADRAAEQLIGGELAAARPEDGVLAEEGEVARAGASGLRWVIDPLDGTVNFLYGHPQWCVSIACEDGTGVLVGVVHDPHRDETFAAVRGGGAHLDGHRLRVTDMRQLHLALVATGFSYDRVLRAEWGHDIADLLPRARDVRRAGSAALDLAWCAAGRLDAFIEFGLAPWDWAAGSLLVTEAGGEVSWPRRHVANRVRRGVIAGGPAMHDALAAWLSTRR